MGEEKEERKRYEKLGKQRKGGDKEKEKEKERIWLEEVIGKERRR